LRCKGYTYFAEIAHMDDVAIFLEQPLVISQEVGINFAVATDEGYSSRRTRNWSNLVN
jgi:hypothetical protein